MFKGHYIDDLPEDIGLLSKISIIGCIKIRWIPLLF